MAARACLLLALALAAAGRPALKGYVSVGEMLPPRPGIEGFAGRSGEIECTVDGAAVACYSPLTWDFDARCFTDHLDRFACCLAAPARVTCLSAAPLPARELSGSWTDGRRNLTFADGQVSSAGGEIEGYCRTSPTLRYPDGATRAEVGWLARPRTRCPEGKLCFAAPATYSEGVLECRDGSRCEILVRTEYHREDGRRRAGPGARWTRLPDKRDEL
jgi:hypothetical protein